MIERLEDATLKIYTYQYYLGDKISKFVNEKFSNKNIYVINEEPLEQRALGFLPFTEECNLIVTNCDIITNLNFLAFKNFHVNNNSDCTLAVSNYKHQIPFGVIKFDKNGNYLKIDEKPVLNEFVFSGICCFSSNFLNLSKQNIKIDMPEFLEIGYKSGLSISIFPIHEQWNDVGRPEDFEKLEDKLFSI